MLTCAPTPPMASGIVPRGVARDTNHSGICNVRSATCPSQGIGVRCRRVPSCGGTAFSVHVHALLGTYARDLPGWVRCRGSEAWSRKLRWVLTRITGTRQRVQSLSQHTITARASMRAIDRSRTPVKVESQADCSTRASASPTLASYFLPSGSCHAAF